MFGDISSKSCFKRMTDNQAEPNYFEFYGLAVALSVDAKALRRIYLENSRKYHPDFHTLASTTSQEKALELSSLNNEAFKTLSDPDRLLHHVLKINGLFSEEGSNEALPQAFLMEMMDINEKIIELESDPDPLQYQQALAAVKDLESGLEDTVGTILKDWTAATGSRSDLLAAKDYFMKKKYLLRVKENLSKFAPASE